MKISLTNIGSKHYITSYGESFVSVKNVNYHRDVIITPVSVIDTWNNVPAFSSESMSHLLSLNPEILIIGTGSKHKNLTPQMLEPLISKSCPFEIMDTPAACRTFNVLVAEDRNVVAALLVTSEHQ